MRRHAGANSGTSPALLEVGGRPVLTHWLTALQDCSWLAPLQQKLFIVCDVSLQSSLRSWAAKHSQALQAGFTGGQQILAARIGSSAAPDQIAALSALAAHGSLPDTLIVIDGASLCEPDFSMHRFIQHALVRNKDTVACSTAPVSQHLHQHFQLDLQGAAANPQVRGMCEKQPAMCNSNSSSCSSFAAPIFAVKGSSIPKLQQAGGLSLCAAIQTQINTEEVYALPVQCSFDLSTLDGYLYAAAFFDFYQQHWKLLHGGEQTAEGTTSEVLSFYLASAPCLAAHLLRCAQACRGLF